MDPNRLPVAARSFAGSAHLANRIGTAPRRRVPWLLVLSGLAVVAVTPGRVQAASTPSAPLANGRSAALSRGWSWRTVDLPATDGVGPVALDAGGTRLALGDEAGLSIRSFDAEASAPVGDAGWRRTALPGAVADLAFAPDGVLWAATQQGLWRVEPDGRRSEASPGPGDDARRVHRVIAVASLVLAATDAGLYASRDGRTWWRATDGFPLAPVGAMAVRKSRSSSTGAESFEVFAVAEARLWRFEVSSDGSGLVLGPARRVAIAGQPASLAPVDVATGFAGDGLVVLFPQAIARTLAPESEVPRWEVVYPVLIPGAIALRLVEAGGGVWLATDQGLMTPERWPTRWRRAGSPAGHTPIFSLAGAPGVVYAAGPSTLLRGRPGGAQSVGFAPDVPGGWAADPALRQVHQKVLERAGLEPRYFERLRKRLSRRGWVPAVSLRAGAAYDVDQQGDYDESFTYGQLQRLNDRFTGRSRDVEGAVTFTWDLADVVYNPDAPDLSREARQVVTLRDNVLDEVNQLYFDRRRALAALAGYADRSDPEAVALAIRCDELAAGLDAWTGGWFSQAIEARR